MVLRQRPKSSEMRKHEKKREIGIQFLANMKKEYDSSRGSRENAEEMRTYVRGQAQIFHNFAKKLKADLDIGPEEAIPHLHKIAMETEVEEGGVLLKEFDPSGTLGNADKLLEHFMNDYLRDGYFLKKFPVELTPEKAAEAA